MSHDDKEDYRDGSCDEDGSMGKVQQRADAGKRKKQFSSSGKNYFLKDLKNATFRAGSG